MYIYKPEEKKITNIKRFYLISKNIYIIKFRNN